MITPFLESLILKNRAFFRTLSCGFSSFLTFPFQENRVYVITDIRITPFLPILKESLTIDGYDIFNKFLTGENFASNQNGATKEIQNYTDFQLQILNPLNSWLFNFKADFGFKVDPTIDAEGQNRTGTSPFINFSEKKINPYLVIDQPTLFQILFPYFNLLSLDGIGASNEKFDIVYNFKNFFPDRPNGPNDINFRVTYAVIQNLVNPKLTYLPLTAEYTAEPYKSNFPDIIREYQIGLKDQAQIIEGIFPDDLNYHPFLPGMLNHFPKLTISYIEILNKKDFEKIA
jgi:hypothetical protein